MEIKMIEYNKSAKKVKDESRAIVMDFLMELLTNALTEERVSRISNTEISFSVTDTTLDTGEIVEVPFVIKPVAKDFEAHYTSTGKERTAFDRVKEADIYEEEKEKEKIEKQKKEEQKQKQIERDKKRRAAAKDKGE